jgi:hypothetical protein
MKQTAFLAVAIVFAVAVPTGPVQAQLARTFVSASGSDANNCGRTTPCRTLQGAHDKTNAGGEINTLDPAGYGTVMITKSISIVNDGVGSAGVLVPSGADGITIDAGANGIVNLRGLIIEGAGVGSSGIVLLTAKSLTIQNCVVRNLINHGIAIVPSTTSTATVSDTYVANNGFVGIVVQPTFSADVNALFNRVEVYNSGTHGIGVFGNLTNGNVQASVTDSVSAHNALDGLFVLQTISGPLTYLLVTRCTSIFNGDSGVVVSGRNARFVIAQSTMDPNSQKPWKALDEGGGLSYGDNYLGGGSSVPIPLPRG